MKRAFILVAVLMAALASSAMAQAPMRPGDAFDLRIGSVPSDDQSTISSTYTVDGEGYVNLAYIGKIQVMHLTPSAIQTEIEHAYVSREIFTHPTITINMQAAARFVNVGGHVKSPTRVSYTPDMTLMSAINAAGDFDEYADQKKVHLIRDGKVTYVNCVKARAHPELDQKVLPGDQIQVPEGFW